MKSHIPTAIALLLVLTACSTGRSVNTSTDRSAVTEKVLSQYPGGTHLDTLTTELNLNRYRFDPHPNLPFGHEQGWYRLPEGDMMVSATLNENGIMLLDATPWILENSEPVERGQ